MSKKINSPIINDGNIQYYIENNLPVPKGYTYSKESLFLFHYKHPLPEGFTHCRGNLNLMNYKHSLPDGFEYCTGNLNLRWNAYPLPSTFKFCVGKLDISGYLHPLPEGFTLYGNDLVAEYYRFLLPKIKIGISHINNLENVESIKLINKTECIINIDNENYKLINCKLLMTFKDGYQMWQGKITNDLVLTVKNVDDDIVIYDVIENGSLVSFSPVIKT